jgi:predicted nucleic acid-binding protein
MTTVIDTNVLIALWDTDPQLNTVVQKALDSAQSLGALVVTGAIYAELHALPGCTERMLDEFFSATGIRVEWESSEQIWCTAGRTFQAMSCGETQRKWGCRAGFLPLS